MSEILYPPYIEGKIPAQVGGTLCIPYLPNRAQGFTDIQGAKIHARIKTSATSTQILELTNEKVEDIQNDKGYYLARFELGEEQKNKLNIGAFYKIQLAFAQDDNTPYYYSTVGVFKYTDWPTVAIEGLDSSQINTLQYHFVGTYESAPEDSNEQPVKSRFDLYHNDTLVETSDWQIYTQAQTYTIKEIQKDQYYYIQYTVLTQNDLEVKSLKYAIKDVDLGIEPQIDCTVVATCNQDTGSILVQLSDITNETVTGRYEIMRRVDGQQTWQVMKTIIFDQQQLKNMNVFNDYTIEHGVSYWYGIRQVDIEKKIYSQIKSSEFCVIARFEDMFLYDGKRQLKIRFNPKISSFKTTLQEQKTDTIGGTYPAFFRNGQLAYKEFPISGLISFQMDNEELFMPMQKENSEIRVATNSKDTNGSYFATNLIDENIYKERQFKLAVLDWLNDGRLKVFRSPAEGNYIVRLMQVSLSPEDRLGRMLHSFSSTAYEAKSFSYETLEKDFKIFNQIEEYTFKKLEFKVENPSEEISYTDLNAIYARVYNAKYGDQIKLVFTNGSMANIYIGTTGAYNINIDEDNPLKTVTFIPKGESSAILEYMRVKKEYYPLYSEGKEIEKVSVKEEVIQVFGSPEQKKKLEGKASFLRIQVINPEVNGTDNIFELDGATIDLSASKRIEYSSPEFAIDLSTLTLGANLQADIYRQYIDIEVK